MHQNTFRVQLSSQLYGLVASLRESLKQAPNGRRQCLAEIACLRCISRLHLLQQQFPCLVVSFNFPLLTFREFKGFARIAEPLPSHRSTHLLQPTSRSLDLGLVGLIIELRLLLTGPLRIHFILSRVAFRYW